MKKTLTLELDLKKMKKTVTIKLELEKESWRSNDDLEDNIESALLDYIDDIVSIDVEVKNFRKTKNQKEEN